MRCWIGERPSVWWLRSRPLGYFSTLVPAPTSPCPPSMHPSSPWKNLNYGHSLWSSLSWPLLPDVGTLSNSTGLCIDQLRFNSETIGRTVNETTYWGRWTYPTRFLRATGLEGFFQSVLVPDAAPLNKSSYYGCHNSGPPRGSPYEESYHEMGQSIDTMVQMKSLAE